MTQHRWQYAIAFFSGIAMVLSFSPFNLYPLAIICPAILFYLWSTVANARRSAWLGFLFGLGLFGAGASWVYISIHEFGFMPAPLAALLVFLFISLLSVFPALAGWLQARLTLSLLSRVLFVMPVMWVLAEWFRGWVLTGFPWLNLGYAHSSSVLMNIAPLAGVYGISLVSAILSALLVLIIAMKGVARASSITFFIAIILFAWGAEKLAFVGNAGEPFNVTLVQGNVPLAEKWKSGSYKKIIKQYAELSKLNINNTQLVVWPEGAIPGSWQQAMRTLQYKLPRQQDERLPDFLVGAIDTDANNAYYNAGVKISAASDTSGSLIKQDGVYRKRHLVAFGEYLPFKPVLGWLINYLKIPMSDFSSWQPDQSTLELAGWPAAVSICYEDAFGEELLDNAGKAAFLLNISEDAWFGDSLAPHQRLQMAQLRARETGRYFVRAANTGFTAVINEKGEITAMLEQFKADVLLATVMPMKGHTPYVRYGNAIVFVLMLFWLLPVFEERRRKAKD